MNKCTKTEMAEGKLCLIIRSNRKQQTNTNNKIVRESTNKIGIFFLGVKTFIFSVPGIMHGDIIYKVKNVGADITSNQLYFKY